MSQESVNVVRGMYEAFAKGDIQSVVAALDPQVEWWEAENFIYADGNPYVGPDAVLRGVFMRLANEWEGFAVSPEGVLDAGDTVIGTATTRHLQEDRPECPCAFRALLHLRDGRVSKFQQYTTRRNSCGPSASRRGHRDGQRFLVNQRRRAAHPAHRRHQVSANLKR